MLQLRANLLALGRLLANDYGCPHTNLCLGISSATPKADKQSLREVRRRMLGEL
jgi:hypothetical protein